MVQLTYRIPDAMAVTGIGRSKIYELVGAGEIEAVHVGRRTLIIAASLNDYIERRRVGPQAPLPTAS